MTLNRPPLALYVHMPWCVRKCPYCDFNSHQAPAGRPLPESRYVQALLDDLEHDLDLVRDRELSSIFIGGGTPSLFSPEAIDELLTGVGRRITCASDLEVTLEANPGTIEHGRFTGYRQAGVTRVSLGVQSLNATQLGRLGRIHSPDDVLRAVQELGEAGIDNFNLDLMYGLSAQTIEEALADLTAALALAPAHLSYYQLTLEPGTVFHHRPPGDLPDADTTWEMQVRAQALLAAHGFEQYEISAYARDDRRCRHNLNYWRFGDYLGIGAGAHGKLTDAASGRIVRTLRHRQPAEYLKAASPAARLQETRAVNTDELPFEFMLNALRLREGFTASQFEQFTGLPFAMVAAPLREARQRGLVEFRHPDAWAPSDFGWRFLNDLQGLFLP